VDRTGERQEELLTAKQCARWATVLDYLIAAMPRDDGLVVVAGTDSTAGTLADRLAVRLRDRGRTGVARASSRTTHARTTMTCPVPGGLRLLLGVGGVGGEPGGEDAGVVLGVGPA
jgi:hypothetical protein